MQPEGRFLPGDKTKEEQLASIIRVDQAGEYGAKRIYQGQLAVHSNHAQIKEMLEQELQHLDYFNHEVSKRKIRPTILQPLWHIGGYMLGAVTAALGEKAAMACTVAVEEVIGDHYNHQINKLTRVHPKEKELKLKIKKFRDEELEHRDIGIAHNAKSTPAYESLAAVIKCITKTAIALSKKI